MNVVAAIFAAVSAPFVRQVPQCSCNSKSTGSSLNSSSVGNNKRAKMNCLDKRQKFVVVVFAGPTKLSPAIQVGSAAVPAVGRLDSAK